MNNERTYQVCKKLVLDTSYPSITFDSEGICSAYHDFYSNITPHWNPGPEGRRRLEQVVEIIIKEGKGKDFDCILGLSGGADSSYMLHVLVNEFGLRPLVFHVDAGWNTEVSVNNINGLIDKLNLDLFTEVINWDEMRDFQLAMFKSGVPHIDIPQDMAFIGVLYKYASKHNIKWILNGGNISTECVSPPLDYYYWGTDMVHVRDILRRFGTIPMPTYPFSSIFYHKIWLRYFRGIKVLKPLNYVPYNKAHAMSFLSSEYGFKPYPQKHFESRFTRFAEGFWVPQRFGFDIRRVQFSSLILTGQMSREEALLQLEIPALDSDIVEKEYGYIAAKLGISRDDLASYFNLPKKSYRDYKNISLIMDIGERILYLLSGTRRGGAF